ncbi:MAG TPA: 2-amino-4-hydroxy-6-hydroxymethyldihydropteridine diphosphokinase [Treponemataceae bacterium]|jgi:2-amino-4-hydroxy-6-hydroxymethyldihydropteridine diphosphokinase|nr:2-amino-4-hydroxy-6-hydroxymethyldihydropteridine diphosphokinase [Treponemataceae bacterium]
MTQVVLGLGSNNSLWISGELLQPEDILKKACVLLSTVLEKESLSFSSVYKTKPLYHTDQLDFLNMIVSGYYRGSALELLSQTQEIEASLGRNRSNELRNGPRTLDIDIEIFGLEILRTEILTIPHEKIAEREFVLIPLLEILPEYADPISGVKYKTIVSALPDQGVIKNLPPFDIG